MPRRLTAHQLGGSCAESDWRKQLVKIGRRRTSAAITVCEAKDVGCPPPRLGHVQLYGGIRQRTGRRPLPISTNTQRLTAGNILAAKLFLQDTNMEELKCLKT